jgi:glycosyltransferase involved in cell wall biosynthesis
MKSLSTRGDGEGTVSANRSIAVLIPCYNEEMTIGKVVDDFARELPDATIYVYDNNSSDATTRIAQEHGAVVCLESRQGKGNVLRQMFRDIEADYYVMVDGDDTYPAEAVHLMLEPLLSNKADLVIGDRLSNLSYRNENKRPFHNFGNNLVRSLMRVLYGVHLSDAMTGYRALSRPFVKTFPILAKGFDIEVEMDIHAIDKNWRIVEVPIDYRDRPEGSFSKLSTVRDGFKVLLTVLSLFKDYRPLVLFSCIGALFVLVGLLLGITVISDFFATGLVERFPSALLSVALTITGLLSLVCGLVLDTTVKGYRKQYELDIIREHSLRK